MERHTAIQKNPIHPIKVVAILFRYRQPMFQRMQADGRCVESGHLLSGLETAKAEDKAAHYARLQ